MKILGSTSWHTESLMTNEEIAKAAIARLGGWIPHGGGGDCPFPDKNCRGQATKWTNNRADSMGLFFLVVGIGPKEEFNVMAYRTIE